MITLASNVTGCTGIPMAAGGFGSGAGGGVSAVPGVYTGSPICVMLATLMTPGETPAGTCCGVIPIADGNLKSPSLAACQPLSYRRTFPDACRSIVIVLTTLMPHGQMMLCT